MPKLKKLQTTTTGISSDLQFNDVGNPYLHKRNKVKLVSVDNTKIGRAIVCDQHIIDKLYTQKHINAQEHAVCNKYLGLIAKSGAFVCSSANNLEKIFTSHNSSSSTNLKPAMLIRIQRVLRYECGREMENAFWNIMVNNPEFTERVAIIVKKSSIALLRNWYINLESPLRSFQQALKDRQTQYQKQ